MKIIYKQILVLFLLTTCLVYTVNAFEIDGFKSGMTVAEVKSNLKNFSYDTVEIEDNRIMASDNPPTSYRLINLGFCNGVLTWAEKHLKPTFELFVRLAKEKREIYGKPYDAWSSPTPLTLNYKRDEVNFVWKENGSTIAVSYTEFGSNNGLSLTYRDSNVCTN